MVTIENPEKLLENKMKLISIIFLKKLNSFLNSVIPVPVNTTHLLLPKNFLSSQEEWLKSPNKMDFSLISDRIYVTENIRRYGKAVSYL